MSYDQTSRQPFCAGKPDQTKWSLRRQVSEHKKAVLMFDLRGMSLNVIIFGKGKESDPTNVLANMSADTLVDTPPMHRSIH